MFSFTGKDCHSKLLFVSLIFLLGAAFAEEPALNRFTLDNGLRVWHCQRTESDSVATLLSIGVGSRNETPEHNGISHLLEHMTFAGTEQYSRAELMELLTSCGGVQNAVTMRERTIFHGQLPAEHFELAVDWLSQLAFHPTLPKDRFKTEQAVVLEEMGGKQGVLRKCFDKMGLGFEIEEQLQRHLFPDCGLSLPVIGTDKSLLSITHSDLLAHYRRAYVPNNAVLVVVGNVDPERVKAACREYFDSVEQGKQTLGCQAPPAPATSAKPFTLRGASVNRQCSLLMGVRTCPASANERWSLDVLAEFVDRNLMRQTRDRGLAYNISAENVSYTDTGCFEISALSRKANLKQIQLIVDNEIEAIRQGRIDPVRFAEAKEALKGRWILAVESSFSHAFWLEMLSRNYGEDDALPDYRARIDAVTPANLTQVVETFFVPDRTSVVRHIPIL